jgi:hypothetical protein
MTVNVVGTWLKADSSPENGKVSFRPSLARLISVSTGAVRPASTVTAILDGSGHISVNLGPTDDTDIQDAPFFYIVTVSVTSQTYSFELTVPSATVGSLNISAQTPTTPRDSLLSRVLTVNGVYPDANGDVTVSGGGGGGGSYIPLTDKGAANGVATLDGSTLLPVAQLPAHDASKVTSGTFNVGRIPDLDSAKITTGTLATGRIPDLSATYLTAAQKHAASGVASLDGSGNLVEPVPAGSVSGVLATGNIPNLDAAKITSGTFSTARIPDLSATYAPVGSYAAAPLVASLGADITGLASTVMADVTGLSASVVAGTYEFEVYVNYQFIGATTTGTLSCVLNGPTASFSAQQWTNQTVSNGTGTTDNRASSAINVMNGTGTVASLGTGNTLAGILRGLIIFTASGTAQFRYKLGGTPGSDTLSILAGSTIVMRKVA